MPSRNLTHLPAGLGWAAEPAHRPATASAQHSGEAAAAQLLRDLSDRWMEPYQPRGEMTSQSFLEHTEVLELSRERRITAQGGMDTLVDVTPLEAGCCNGLSTCSCHPSRTGPVAAEIQPVSHRTPAFDLAQLPVPPSPGGSHPYFDLGIGCYRGYMTTGSRPAVPAACSNDVGSCFHPRCAHGECASPSDCWDVRLMALNPITGDPVGPLPGYTFGGLSMGRTIRICSPAQPTWGLVWKAITADATAPNGRAYPPGVSIATGFPHSQAVSTRAARSHPAIGGREIYVDTCFGQRHEPQIRPIGAPVWLR